MIRKATKEDIPAIMSCFDIARQFMRKNGNLKQWINGYPSEAAVQEDMAAGNCYVFEEDGEVVGTFAFIIGQEPTYGVIEDGAWSYDLPYGTIHRIASNGAVKGLAEKCFTYCREKIPYLRVDTHADNIPMQEAVKKFGFKPCGIIYVSDGSPRVAFDYYYK